LWLISLSSGALGFFFLRSDRAHPHLHSFPTRRSSDLLADPEITKQWLEYFKAADAGCIAMDARQKKSANAIKKPIIAELSALLEDRKSTRLNSSHVSISYAVFCLKKKKKKPLNSNRDT